MLAPGDQDATDGPGGHADHTMAHRGALAATTCQEIRADRAVAPGGAAATRGQIDCAMAPGGQDPAACQRGSSQPRCGPRGALAANHQGGAVNMGSQVNRELTPRGQDVAAHPGGHVDHVMTPQSDLATATLWGDHAEFGACLRIYTAACNLSRNAYAPVEV